MTTFIKHFLWLLLVSFFHSEAIAVGQEGQDFYQSIGKMYVVVTVIALIFIGLAIYLYRRDKKIKNLEK